MLQQCYAPRVNVRELTVGDEDKDSEGHIVLYKLLDERRRELRPDQVSLALDRLRDEPTTLYMNLMVRQVSSWKSTDGLPELRGTVAGLIDQIFDEIERKYGTLLVRHALALMSYAREGLSDTEMIDLLSLDENVLDSVFQYHTPSIRRLPDHVWLRVRGELTGLIMERRGGCVYWYHRQLWETAQRRYADEKLLCHYYLGKYFSGQISEDVVSAKKLTKQDYTLTKEIPIWFKDCIVNRRRGLEGYYHLCEYATAVLHYDYSKSLANRVHFQLKLVLDIQEEAIQLAVQELCNLDM